jgi:hypothetical protein
MGIISEKKALIVVNADVTVAYDLHLMKYDIDEKTKQYRLFIFQRRKLKLTPILSFMTLSRVN